MKKNNLKLVKIEKAKSLFNYEKKILINELILNLKLGYYDFEKKKSQKISKKSISLHTNDYDKFLIENAKSEIRYIDENYIYLLLEIHLLKRLTQKLSLTL